MKKIFGQWIGLAAREVPGAAPRPRALVCPGAGIEWVPRKILLTSVPHKVGRDSQVFPQRVHDCPVSHYYYAAALDALGRPEEALVYYGGAPPPTRTGGPRSWTPTTLTSVRPLLPDPRCLRDDEKFLGKPHIHRT